MLDPRLPDARRRAGPMTLLAATALLLAAGAWLTYVGIDWKRNGCGCDESLYPEWLWIPLLALAAASFGAAIALGLRAAKRKLTA